MDSNRWLVETAKRIDWLLIQAKSDPEKRLGIGLMVAAMESLAIQPTTPVGGAVQAIKELVAG